MKTTAKRKKDKKDAVAVVVLQRRVDALEASIASLKDAIEQVNLNDAERYRRSRDQIAQFMKEMRKRRKDRKRLDWTEPWTSSWQF